MAKNISIFFHQLFYPQGHNQAVDWWSLGILIFEMLAGYPPFYADNPLGIYEAILGGKIDWPKSVDGLAKDLIRKAIKKRILNLDIVKTVLRGCPKLFILDFSFLDGSL